LISYDFFGDVPLQIVNAGRKFNITIANNSWGLGTGWEWEDEWVWYGDEPFGYYSSESRAFDTVVHDEDIIVVFAAGNDREDIGPGNGQYYDYEKDQHFSNKPHKPDGPYSCIAEHGSAKNVITVGAVKDRGKMTAFSSWGPTADGRIKPEICANGEELFSTVKHSSYKRMSGTSMAAPAVTGGLSLIAQLWHSIRGDALPPEVARAVLIASARDAGQHGPDYQYGFGIMDVKAMADVVSGTGAGMILQGTIGRNPRVKSFPLQIPDGLQRMRASLSWIDPPGSLGTGTALVNDLDICLISPSSKKYFPWVLDPKNAWKRAERGYNRVDVTELVEVDFPEAGLWTVEITSLRIAEGISQKFAVATYFIRSIAE
jgi:hypothetical protein